MYLLVGFRKNSGEGGGGGGILSIVKLSSSYGLSMGANKIFWKNIISEMMNELISVCGTARLQWVCYLVYCPICADNTQNLAWHAEKVSK